MNFAPKYTFFVLRQDWLRIGGKWQWLTVGQSNGYASERLARQCQARWEKKQRGNNVRVRLVAIPHR